MSVTISESKPKFYRILNTRSFFQLVVIHAILGFVVGILPSLAYYWGILILVIGFYKIYLSNDRQLDAAKFAAYYMAMEVLLRITKGYVTWEFAKYGVILFLVLGIMFSQRRRIPPVFIVLVLLLFPSLVVIDFPNLNEARTSILFNISGPFCLAVSGLYFYKRKVSNLELFDILKYSLLPIIALLSYLTFFTPDFETIEFASEAVFETSGGFGPNQMSTVLGFGMSVLLIGIITKRPFFKYWWLDLTLLLYLGFRSLITFSRGGTLSIILVFSVFLIIIFAKGRMSKLQNSFLILVLLVLGAFVTWNYANKISNEALLYRYQGTNIRTGQEEDITSGRLLILTEELDFFKENPIFGVGPGMGKVLREREIGLEAAAHSEFSRLLGEHGLFGLISVFIILGIPIIAYFKSKNGPLVAVTLIWSVLAIYTMLHSAMRLSLPGYVYGLGLINLYVPQKKDIIHRK